MKIRHGILPALLPLSLAGCMMVGPDYRRPELPVPAHWRHAAPGQQRAVVDRWWQTFNDAELNRLIADAVHANLDYRQALARIKDARAQRVAIFAAALPSLSAHSNASRRLNSTTSGGSSSTVGGGFGIGNQLISIFQSGFDTQWELDLFGGAERTAENADATVAAEIENSRDVLVSVQAEIARNYIALRANQQLAALARDLIQSRQETLALAQALQQSGLATQWEVADAQSQLAAAEAEQPVYQRDSETAIHALSLLLGQPPGALQARLARSAALPAIQTAIVTDLPASLLQRRPDIRRAERTLAAANAAIGAAVAELYPKINLSAFLGLQNTRVADVTPLGKSWSTAASLTLPIFNWGRLNADIDSKTAQTEAALAAYRATVLGAFRDVEDALVGYDREQQRHAALAAAVAANRLALALAEERYHKGLTAYSDVLQNRQTLYQAENALLTSHATLANQQIALYKALGGGWQTTADECRGCKKQLAEQVRDYGKALSKW